MVYFLKRLYYIKKVVENFIRENYRIWEKSKNDFRAKNLKCPLTTDEIGDKNFNFIFCLRNVTIRGEDILFFEAYLYRDVPKDPKKYFRSLLLEVGNADLKIGGIVGFLTRIRSNCNGFLEDSQAKADKLLLRYINGV